MNSKKFRVYLSKTLLKGKNGEKIFSAKLKQLFNILNTKSSKIGFVLNMLRIFQNRVTNLVLPFFNRGKKLDTILKDYEENLQKQNLPVIYSLQHLCLMAGVNIEKIKKCTSIDRIYTYKKFKLKKRRGGFRIIQTPSKELKYLQRWILVNILNKVKSHENVSYRGRSYPKNGPIEIF